MYGIIGVRKLVFECSYCNKPCLKLTEMPKVFTWNIEIVHFCTRFIGLSIFFLRSFVSRDIDNALLHVAQCTFVSTTVN